MRSRFIQSSQPVQCAIHMQYNIDFSFVVLSFFYLVHMAKAAAEAVAAGRAQANSIGQLRAYALNLRKYKLHNISSRYRITCGLMYTKLKLTIFWCNDIAVVSFIFIILIICCSSYYYVQQWLPLSVFLSYSVCYWCWCCCRLPLRLLFFRLNWPIFAWRVRQIFSLCNIHKFWSLYFFILLADMFHHSQLTLYPKLAKMHTYCAK